MLLASATVGPFKTIDRPQTVAIEPDVTALVGLNETGKTAFLHALAKSADALGVAAFEPVDDYPRKDLPSYLKEHKTRPAVATRLEYRLEDREADALSRHLGTTLPPDFSFAIAHNYDNEWLYSMSIDERPAVMALAEAHPLSAQAKRALQSAATLRDAPAALRSAGTTNVDLAFLKAVESRVAVSQWRSVLAYEAYRWLDTRVPRFLYFGDAEILPSRTNLADLAQRAALAKHDPKQMPLEHRGVVALLRMADVDVETLANPTALDPLRAKVQAVAIALTDQIMEFWRGNENVEVEVDIRNDPSEPRPFNEGPNLYLRVRNRREGAVSTPFRQRSRGFNWFFSFLVWFDSVRQQLANPSSEHDVILLLDEPGLGLHPLAQSDVLTYLDDLAIRHQVIYTSHSPFMLHADRLRQVRVVEHRPEAGTVVTDRVAGSSERTLFPLQAALGWSVAQNLFVADRNLLVDGLSDLLYLKTVSAILEKAGRTALRRDLAIVPVGGLDKIVTFIALSGASVLKFGVLHDYRGVAERKLVDLVKQKRISAKAILNASQFRDLSSLGNTSQPSDLEDLIAPGTYVGYFRRAFAGALNGVPIEADLLPPGDRIVDRLERYLDASGVTLRTGGGFAPDVVALEFAGHPPAALDEDTLKRFEALCTAVNAIF